MFVNFRRLTLKCLLISRADLQKRSRIGASKLCVFFTYHGNNAKCSVLLFRPSQNKETLEKVGTCATSIILADLAKATDIDFSVGYESETNESELNFSFSVKKNKQGISLLYFRQMCKCYQQKCTEQANTNNLANSNKKNYRVEPSRRLN